MSKPLPQTPEEWQSVVNMAQLCLLLESACMYGLVTHTYGINAERCEEILREGKQRGYVPPSTDALLKTPEAAELLGV